MNTDPTALTYFDLEKLAPAPAVLLWEPTAAAISALELDLFHQRHFDIERVATLDQLLDSAVSSSHPLTGESRFEMILLDEALLEREGVQVLMLLKRMPETKNVPILIVGRHSCSENFTLWMRAGASGFMTR